jgi:DNA helicase-2/ATP-dependent DNA helicase PcrA
VCVVCRWKKEIEATVAALARELGSEAPVRAGHNDRFEFAPGVTVTNYRQVKGLEFDTVIVLDPTGHAYPATTQGRRNLYMVVTRAKDALHLVAVREATPLLSPAIAAGLVELHEETSVPEVAFTEADDAPF